eukprot:429777-Amphidinium_carterae.1
MFKQVVQAHQENDAEALRFKSALHLLVFVYGMQIVASWWFLLKSGVTFQECRVLASGQGAHLEVSHVAWRKPHNSDGVLSRHPHIFCQLEREPT